MQTLADTIVDSLAAAIARGLGWIARGLEAWRSELAAELAANRSGLAREKAAAARCRPCPIPATSIAVRRRPCPPPVPAMLVNGQPAYAVRRAS